MNSTLTPSTIALVKASYPALQTHGLAITTRMYERLFVHPEIKALFDQAAQASGEQPRRLATAIAAYAKNIDNLGALSDAVQRMAERHVQAQVKPEHYPLVAEALLAAIKDVLGDAATPDILAAWSEAYAYLAEILIAEERRRYAA